MNGCPATGSYWRLLAWIKFNDWHLGHLACFPACSSGTRNVVLQLEQVNSIATLNLDSFVQYLIQLSGNFNTYHAFVAAAMQVGQVVAQRVSSIFRQARFMTIPGGRQETENACGSLSIPENVPYFETFFHSTRAHISFR